MDSIDKFGDPKVGASQINYGVQSKSSFKKMVATLGGGYELRQRVGTQHSFQTFSCTWGAMDAAKAQEIKNFIDEKGGVDAFLFTHPITRISYKVVCDDGATITHDAPRTATVTADLREVQA